eukprot:6211847-Pleurochrysis_carterae.AAC.3
MVEHGLSVDAASMALRRGKALPVLPPDALPLESKHHGRIPLNSERALVFHDVEWRRLCCVDSEQPNLILATVSYSPKGRRANSPTRTKTVGETCLGLAHTEGIKTDGTEIGFGKQVDPHDISPSEVREGHFDAEEYKAQMEEVRTLLDKWEKPFDDLSLTQRRRLHSQACERRGLLHQALSDESFRPGAGRVADTYVEVALDAYLSPRTTQKVLLRYTKLQTPVQTDLSAIHQSMYSVACFPVHNPSDEPVLLLHSTRFGSVTLRPDLEISRDDFTFVSPADSDWEGVDRISALAVEQAGESRREGEIATGRSKDWEGVAEDGEENVSLRYADANEGRALFEGLRSFALPMEVERHRVYYNLPFKEGGPARSLQGLESLGLDLSQF